MNEIFKERYIPGIKLEKALVLPLMVTFGFADEGRLCLGEKHQALFKYSTK